MSEKFKYKALSNGTLTKPYKQVMKGEVVIRDEAVKCKWLVPFEEYVEKKAPPIMSNIRQRSLDGITAMSQIPSDLNNAYTKSMENVLDNEAAQDAPVVAPAEVKQETPAVAVNFAEAPIVTTTGSLVTDAKIIAPVSAEAVDNGSEGTGNQEVI
jgi:hypothetical protein